jgi:hypothetical protein
LSNLFGKSFQSCSLINFSLLQRTKNGMRIRVEWFAFFEKFKNPVVLKAAYVYHNQFLFYNFLKFWDLPLAHRPWRLKRYGTFSGSKLLADFKNVHGLYVWMSILTTRSKKVKDSWNIQIFSIGFFRWPLYIRTDLHSYKICTFLESGSNFQLEKVP